MDVDSSLYREDRDSILLKTFGRSPKTRILDLFLDNPFFEFTRMEMIKALGMAKVTMYNTLPEIEAHGMIVPTRKIGRSQLYRLNGDSEAVKNLRRLIRDISFKIAEAECFGSDAIVDEGKTPPGFELIEDDESERNLLLTID